MTEDVDFDGTVDEVKQQIRDLEDPDYQSLLEQEKGNKDRKTIKDFIQKQMDNEEVEVSETEEEVEDELVEEIEEETSGGLLGGVSPAAVLTVGIAAGLVLGLMLGLVLDMSSPETEISPQEAQDQVESIVELQFNDYEFTEDPTIRNSMYYVPAEITQEVEAEDGNGTETESFEQNFYLTTDGALLFPEQQQFGQVISPINIEQELEMAEQQQQQQPSEEDLELDEEDLEEELEIE